MEEKQYEFWLGNIPTIGRNTIGRLLNFFSDAKAVYEADDIDLRTVITGRQLLSLKDTKKKWNTEKRYHELLQKGIHFVSITDDKYPERIRRIPDAPYGLYVLGSLPDETASSVAVIGARACSQYGRQVAAKFGEDLALHGVNLVSGLAYGVDSISQYAAVRAGGQVYAVLGSGVDVCYPAEHARLYHSIQERGGIISEYPPGTEPKPQLFPARNRLISALADIILVVEAKQKSGTAITVTMALEQGKEVYAVPGRINECCSEGCNRLIQDGAGMALDIEDLLNALEKTDYIYKNATKTIKNQLNISAEEKEIMSILVDGEKTVDDIIKSIQRTDGYGNSVQMTAGRLNVLLTGLELKDLIKQKNGFYRIPFKDI